MDAPRPTASRADVPTAAARGRILGIDFARALAIVGMFMVHVGPTDAGGLAGRLYALSHGRASILFVLVAGIGVSLLAASRRRSRARASGELVWRSAVLLVVGLALQELEHRVFVILQTYALLFLVAILAVRLPGRWLLVAAGALALLGPGAYLAGVLFDPATFDRSSVRIGDGLGGVVHGLLLSGPYPLVVWSPPFLLGMWIGRRDLRARGAAVRLVVAGGAGAAFAYLAAWSLRLALAPDGMAGWARLLDATPHSQMPPWLLGSSGSAVLVLGASLMLARAWPKAAWPLAAMGQLALSTYVAHLLVLHAWSDAVRSDDVGAAAAAVAALTFAAVLLAVAWRSRLPRGPLEALIRWPPLPRPRA